MSQKKIKLIRKQDREKAELSRKVSVDMLEIPSSGLHFSASFSFDLNEGTNNFYQMSEVVDEQINAARLDILEKLANKLGVKVNFNQ